MDANKTAYGFKLDKRTTVASVVRLHGTSNFITALRRWRLSEDNYIYT